MKLLRPAAKNHPAIVSEAGFGQSLLDDLRFMLRFRHCRATTAILQTPERVVSQQFDDHALLGRFGDFTVAVAEIDGRRWVVRERAFYGWPDPPHWVFFAFEPDDTVWCARDFDVWPARWRIGGSVP